MHAFNRLFSSVVQDPSPDDIPLDPDAPLDDVQFLFIAIKKHIKLNVGHLDMVRRLHPFGSNFFAIITEAVNQFDRDESDDDDLDDALSDNTDLGDFTYKEKWDPFQILVWMLNVYRNMPEEAKIIYTEFIEILEKRTARRWAEIEAADSPKDPTTEEQDEPDDALRELPMADGLMSSINILPPEILSEIFVLSAEGIPLMPITLSHISSFARGVANNAPRLWSNVSIRLSPRIVSLYLRRSKAAPLIVDAVMPPLLDHWTAKSIHSFGKFLSQLRPHRHRIQILSIHQHIALPPNVSMVTEFLTGGALGKALRVLEMGEVNQDVDEHRDRSLLLDLWKDSMLAPEHLIAHGSFATSWSFRLVSFDRIVRLEISGNSELLFDSLMEGLSRSPHLESLKLSTCHIEGECQTPPTISLPKLYTIEIAHLLLTQGVPFFGRLGFFPGLRTFSMTCAEISEQKGNSDIVNFLRRHPDITDLRFDDVQTSPDGWRMVFACCPSVTDLRLANCSLLDDSLAVLEVPLSDGTEDDLMPNLQHLTLENEWSINSLAITQVVKSRLAASVEQKEGAVQPLRLITLRGWSTNYIKEDLAAISEDAIGDIFGGDEESDLGSEYDEIEEYAWSDIDENELAFGGNLNNQ